MSTTTDATDEIGRAIRASNRVWFGQQPAEVGKLHDGEDTGPDARLNAANRATR